MNWIILIIAGLCEVGFTYCLGRAKAVEGVEWWALIGGFVVISIMSMVLLAKATQFFPYAHDSLRHRASDRQGRHRIDERETCAAVAHTDTTSRFPNSYAFLRS